MQKHQETLNVHNITRALSGSKEEVQKYVLKPVKSLMAGLFKTRARQKTIVAVY